MNSKILLPEVLQLIKCCTFQGCHSIWAHGSFVFWGWVESGSLAPVVSVTLGESQRPLCLLSICQVRRGRNLSFHVVKPWGMKAKPLGNSLKMEALILCAQLRGCATMRVAFLLCASLFVTKGLNLYLWSAQPEKAIYEACMLFLNEQQQKNHYYFTWHMCQSSESTIATRHVKF
jgi:hypothetical protein